MQYKETEKFDFSELPSFLQSYGRAILSFRKPLLEASDWPRIEAHVRDVAPDPERVRHYRAVCSLPESIALPSAYPQVIAAPLHAAMLTCARFPFRAFGLVHLANRIIEHRVIYENESLDMECLIDGYRETEKGVEFSLTTRVFIGAEEVWESVATLLARAPQRPDQHHAAKRFEAPSAEPAPSQRVNSSARVKLWNIPSAMGRRYASVAGDYNPIHLHPLTARLFGLKHPIIQGMWSLARAMGEIEVEMPRFPRMTEVTFRKPVILPSVALFSSMRDRHGLQFSLRTTDGRIVFLQGSVKRSICPPSMT